MSSEVDTINNVINSVISASPLLIALAPFAGWLKFWINKNNVSKEELENIIDRFRRDINKELDEKEHYIQLVDKKAQQNGKDIARLEGKVES